MKFCNLLFLMIHNISRLVEKKEGDNNNSEMPTNEINQDVLNTPRYVV